MHNLNIPNSAVLPRILTPCTLRNDRTEGTSEDRLHINEGEVRPHILLNILQPAPCLSDTASSQSTNCSHFSIFTKEALTPVRSKKSCKACKPFHHKGSIGSSTMADPAVNIEILQTDTLFYAQLLLQETLDGLRRHKEKQYRTRHCTCLMSPVWGACPSRFEHSMRERHGMLEVQSVGLMEG